MSIFSSEQNGRALAKGWSQQLGVSLRLFGSAAAVHTLHGRSAGEGVESEDQLDGNWVLMGAIDELTHTINTLNWSTC